MDKWNEIRTAYQVARLGTVSAAAEVLGVHRATVIRQIDALEAEFGAKIFQRHSRGYTPTEAGRDLLRVAQMADEQFDELAGRTRARKAEVSGELIVTSVDLVAPMLVHALDKFRKKYPKTTVRYIVSEKLLKLEYGEAHVAVRAGAKPDYPDNIVQPFLNLQSGLYAHKDYVDRCGKPASEEEFDQHAFIGTAVDDSRLPLYVWMRERVPESNIVLKSQNIQVRFRALLAGMGIGFYPSDEAQRQPELVEIMAPKAEWAGEFWLVTHVDLHQTAKIQAFLELIKKEPSSFKFDPKVIGDQS